MRKIRITNETLNSIEFVGGSSSAYVLQVLRGEGTPESSPENLKSPNQDGYSYIQSLLESRELYAEVGVLESNFSSLFAIRDDICRLLSPKQELTIVYTYPGGTKQIKGHLLSEVEFPRGGRRGYQTAAFTIECSNPMWNDVEPTGVKLAVSTPLFHFPLIFNPNIAFSVILNKEVTVNNTGHVNTPILIQFFGATVNPVITNETTGEFIKVNRTLLAGEIMEINTEFGNKYVLIDGANAFGDIDDSSRFFDLELGENVISYDADSGSDSAEVVITYNNLYLGV